MANASLTGGCSLVEAREGEKEGFDLFWKERVGKPCYADGTEVQA